MSGRRERSRWSNSGGTDGGGVDREWLSGRLAVSKLRPCLGGILSLFLMISGES